MGSKDPQVSHMSEFEQISWDMHGVHINMGIVNKAAHLMCGGGTFRDVTLFGIGRARLARL